MSLCQQDSWIVRPIVLCEEDMIQTYQRFSDETICLDEISQIDLTKRSILSGRFAVNSGVRIRFRVRFEKAGMERQS